MLESRAISSCRASRIAWFMGIEGMTGWSSFWTDFSHATGVEKTSRVNSSGPG